MCVSERENILVCMRSSKQKSDASELNRRNKNRMLCRFFYLFFFVTEQLSYGINRMNDLQRLLVDIICCYYFMTAVATVINCFRIATAIKKSNIYRERKRESAHELRR